MTSRIGPNGQVVIPRALRDQLDIGPGDEVGFTFGDGGVRIDVVKDSPSLRGQFAGAGPLEALEADHRRERARRPTVLAHGLCWPG